MDKSKKLDGSGDDGETVPSSEELKFSVNSILFSFISEFLITTHNSYSTMVKLVTMLSSP